MEEEARRRLEARCTGRRVRLLEFHPDLPGLMRAAALVVAMGGYNTVCELVASGTKGLIVPRAQPRLEQHIRAQAFAARGLVSMVPASEATPARLAAAIERALSAAPPGSARAQWDGRGLPRLAARIDAALGGRAERRASA